MGLRLHLFADKAGSLELAFYGLFKPLLRGMYYHLEIR